MNPPPTPIDTLEEMIREREPNLLRLYLNPHVAQAAYCLDRYVRTTWPGSPDEDCQSFLANSLDEAIGGAIKLVRYNRPPAGSERIGLVLDLADRLVGFADLTLPDGDRVEFLPGLLVVGRDAMIDGDQWARRAEASGATIDPLVIVGGDVGLTDAQEEAIRGLIARHRPAVIVAIDRGALAALRDGKKTALGDIVPDVVVFDESFAGRAVPFGAFTARRSLFAAWNAPKKSTFHSTTFQPNTISARHFVARLVHDDPDFARRHADALRAIADTPERRAEVIRRHYSPALVRLIRASGFATADIHAIGGAVVVDGRPVLDFVGGVACSLRGHNPPTYVEEIRALPGPAEVETELRGRLRSLTGLGHVLPAVSGGTAVENALRLALVARFPRRHVLALRAGFGGKTLFSLTGTANPSYKDRVGPLYADVHYVDPFAADAREQVDALLRTHEFAAVQIELIQSVGGVRRLPESLVRHLDEGRARGGYLLIVDEIQTGMYRTGPFAQSGVFGLTADLMLLGKATSDMMVPTSLTLYSDAVAAALEGRGSALLDAIRRRYGHELGYKTVLNALRAADDLAISDRVIAAGERFARLLGEGLGPLKPVRDVRVFGLLIAVELEIRSGPARWLRRRLAAPYLLAMLRHETFPVLAGFCQYEPHTLKITPSLDIGPEDVDRACRTIVDVLGRPLPGVFLAGLGSILKPPPIRKGRHERRDDPALEPLAR